MDASIIVAIVALGVSLASAWYARRLAGVESDRRHEERMPRFSLSGTATPVPHPDGRQLLLTVLTNDGPEDLDEVHLELVQGGPVIGMTLQQSDAEVSRRVMAGGLPTRCVEDVAPRAAVRGSIGARPHQVSRLQRWPRVARTPRHREATAATNLVTAQHLAYGAVITTTVCPTLRRPS